MDPRPLSELLPHALTDDRTWGRPHGWGLVVAGVLVGAGVVGLGMATDGEGLWSGLLAVLAVGGLALVLQGVLDRSPVLDARLARVRSWPRHR